MSSKNEPFFFEKDFWKQIDSKTNQFILNTSNINNFLPIWHPPFDYQGEYFFGDKTFPREMFNVEGPEFTYRVNQNGFRSNSFSTFDENNNNILTSGCSLTHGVGLPEEYTWGSKLSHKMNNSNLYNLGIPGSNVFRIVRDILTFINLYGKPKYIFVLFPELSRRIKFDRKSVNYENVVPGDDNPRDVFDLKVNYENSFLMHTSMIHFLEFTCNALNINLLWSTWDFTFTKLLNDANDLMNFKNYLILPTYCRNISAFYLDKDFKKQCEELSKFNINNEPYWAAARDGRHPGTYYAEYVAENFYKELQK